MRCATLTTLSKAIALESWVISSYNESFVLDSVWLKKIMNYFIFGSFQMQRDILPRRIRRSFVILKGLINYEVEVIGPFQWSFLIILLIKQNHSR